MPNKESYNEEKSPRKIYAVDTGLCNAVGFRFSENVGHLAENIVFLNLKQKQIINPNMELFYWKAMKELKCENALIITENIERIEKLNDYKVEIIPLWKWLLSIET